MTDDVSQAAGELPRYTIDCSSNEYGTGWRVEADSDGSLCLHADAQAIIANLTAQVERLTAERDEWRKATMDWVRENGPGGWINALRAAAGDAEPTPTAIWCKHCGEGPIIGFCRLRKSSDLAPMDCAAMAPSATTEKPE